MTSSLIVVGAWLLYLGFRVWGLPLDKDRVSYWQTSVQGLDEEPDVFFGQVYLALKEGLASRDVQLSGMGFGPTKLFETHSILSSRPLYLEARYKHLSYYLFLGQTPTGLFLSSRVYNKFVKGEGSKGILSYAALKYFQRQTMFQYDASIMFLESVHAIVLTVLDSYIEEKKLKPLEEYERRPILHAFYANAYPPRPQEVWAMPAPVNATPSSNLSTSTATPSESPQPAKSEVLPLEPDATRDATLEINGIQSLSPVVETSRANRANPETSSTQTDTTDQTSLDSSVLHDEAVSLDKSTEPMTLPNPTAEQSKTMPSTNDETPPRSGRVLPL